VAIVLVVVGFDCRVGVGGGCCCFGTAYPSYAQTFKSIFFLIRGKYLKPQSVKTNKIK
jgi:hypothetical protein